MVISIYASILALMFVGLSFRTLILRRRFKVAVGDDGQEILQRAIRAHGNFSEYVPIALILIYLLELQNAVGWLIHALGAALLTGRIFHAYGVSQLSENFVFRVSGMVITLTVIISSALRLLLSSMAAI